MFNHNHNNYKWAVVTNASTVTSSIEFLETRKLSRSLAKTYKRFDWKSTICKVKQNSDGSVIFEKSH